MISYKKENLHYIHMERGDNKNKDSEVRIGTNAVEMCSIDINNGTVAVFQDWVKGEDI